MEFTWIGWKNSQVSLMALLILILLWKKELDVQECPKDQYLTQVHDVNGELCEKAQGDEDELVLENRAYVYKSYVVEWWWQCFSSLFNLLEQRSVRNV